jgi:hypothetical protein
VRIPLIGNERVNGFRLDAQALSPRVESAEEALRAAGCVPAREAAYLSVEARVLEFSRQDLDHLVFTDREYVELLAMRGESWVLPSSLLPHAMRCPAPVFRDGAERLLADASVAMTGRQTLRDRVSSAVRERPRTHAELVSDLADRDDYASQLLARPGVLGAILTFLRLDGEVARSNLSGSLDRGRALWVPAEMLLPGVDLSGLDPRDALLTLCAWYFRVHGPATVADFGWWSGSGSNEVRDAFARHRTNLVAIRIEGQPFNYYLPPSRAEELMRYERPGADSVVLVPFGDPWLFSHEGRAGRFVQVKHLSSVVPGPALPAVLLGGMTIGRWKLDVEADTVEFHWFRPPPQGVLERAVRRGREVLTFVKRELESVRTLTVPAPGGAIPVYR